MILAMAFGGFASLVLFALGGFVLARDNVAKWWLWGYYSSPMMYGMNAIVVNEFLGHQWHKVASWGAYLMSRNILTVSFAPRDTHEAQVQFALERGVPALIGVLASIRLPYPSSAFDMAHCSRCLIPWGKNDGLYLIEVDRILRPGGYCIFSGPPINWQTRWKGWDRTRNDLEAE